MKTDARCLDDLRLMIFFLEKSHQGVDMNMVAYLLLTFAIEVTHVLTALELIVMRNGHKDGISLMIYASMHLIISLNT